MKIMEASGLSWKTRRSGDTGPTRLVGPQPLPPSPLTPASHAAAAAAPPPPRPSHPTPCSTARRPASRPPGRFLQGRHARHLTEFFPIPHSSVVPGSGLTVSPSFVPHRQQEERRTPESERSAMLKAIRQCGDPRGCGHRTSPTKQGTDRPGTTKLRPRGMQGTTCTLVVHSRTRILPLQIWGEGLGEPNKLAPHH